MTLGMPRMLRKVSRLAREGGVGEILGRSARPHGHRYGFIVAGQGAVRLGDLRLERLRKFGGFDPAADLLPAPGERFDVFGVHTLQPCFDAAREAALREELAEGVGGGGKPSRNPDSRPGKLGNHLAQGGVLSSDLLDIGHPEPVEIHHIFEPGHQPVLRGG
jgi:hypothetical protein